METQKGKTLREMFEQDTNEMYQATENLNKAKTRLKNEKERLRELRYAVTKHEETVDKLQSYYESALCRVTELDYRLQNYRKLLNDKVNGNVQ